MDTTKRLRSEDLLFLPPDIAKKDEPTMEEQLAVHLNGKTNAPATLGAGPRLTRFAQQEFDIDPDKPINPDAIRKIDADVGDLRKILYRVIVADFVQDDKVQSAIDVFVTRYRSACLDLMDRRDYGGQISSLVRPVADVILQKNIGQQNEEAVMLIRKTLSETQTEIIRGLCKKWAMKHYNVYRLSYLVAGALGFQEPRNLLTFNYIDTMMSIGVEKIRDLCFRGGENNIQAANMYDAMTGLLTVGEYPVCNVEKQDFTAVLKQISPYYDLTKVDEWEGVLSAALNTAVTQAYDFVRIHVSIRTKRSSASDSALQTKYRHLLNGKILSKKVLFDDYKEDRPGYVSFNPELVNLIAAYIPRSWAAQNLEHRVGMEMLNITKRQNELLLKIGLMGI